MNDLEPASRAGLSISHSLITGGTFNVYLPFQEKLAFSVAPSARHDSLGRGRGGLPTLEDTVAFGAMLNAAERYPAPRCDPDTRHTAQRVATDWILVKAGSGDEEIMWLSGAPGVGKSAILQTICEMLEGCGKAIDAVHFFGRGQGRREKAIYFPATVAYQLASASDAYHSLLDQTIKSNPSIFTQALESQFRKLIIGPTAAMAGALPLQTSHITIVIDALDELDSVADQIALLELIFSAARQQRTRFLIASRPEQAIHAFFNRPDVLPHVSHVRLDEETFQTSRDIYLFLAKSFARIRQSRPGSYPKLPNGELWPGIAILRRLTADSDAQFIFAHLIIDSINADLVTSPHEQLQRMLEHTSSDTFSKLDSLYHQILSRCLEGRSTGGGRNKTLLMGILRVIISWPVGLSVAGIADVMDEETFVVENIVRGSMRCLFKFDDNELNSDVALCHKSLRDCVLSRDRAGEFFISSDEPDEVFTEILMRPPPSDCQRSFPPQVLFGVVLCIKGLCYFPKIEAKPDVIASILEVEPEILRNVLHGPQRSLFSSEEDSKAILLLDEFQRFSDSPKRSGDFCVPQPTAMDAMFLHILSRPPPCDPELSFSRQDLMGVLQVLATFWLGDPLTIFEVASVLATGASAVRNIVQGPQSHLFRCNMKDKNARIQFEEGILGFNMEFVDFLRDSNRSREFYAPQNATDNLLLSSLIRPPPTHLQPSFSPQDLKRVLHAIFVYEERLTVAHIASILGVEPDVVQNVVSGPQQCFFRLCDDHVGFRPSGLNTFFMDASRSRDLYLSDSDTASLFLPALCRPPSTNPDEYFSRQNLLGVLLVIFLFGENYITIPDIATLMGVEPRIVRNVICGPQSLLFRIYASGGEEVVIFGHLFAHFLADASLAGEFYISTKNIDIFLMQLLSRAPPIDPQTSYCRRDFMAVIWALLAFHHFTLADISSVLGIGPDVVRNIAKGPHRFLFYTTENTIAIPSEPIRSFFQNPDRSGEFHISRDDIDIFLIRYLSIPPPVDPEDSYTRQCLMEVIRFLFISELDLLNDDKRLVVDVASALNLNLDILFNVIFGPHRGLFRVCDTGDVPWEEFFVHARSGARGIKDFLLDPARSREFYL